MRGGFVRLILDREPAFHRGLLQCGNQMMIAEMEGKRAFFGCGVTCFVGGGRGNVGCRSI